MTLKKVNEKKVIKIGYAFEYKSPPKVKVPKGCDRFVQLHCHCLAGDSIIHKASKITEWKTGRLVRTDYTNKKKCRTIKYLYDHTRRNNSPTWWYKVKAFDRTKERFVQSELINIIKTGKKKIYKVTTDSGKFLRTSLYHKYLTRKGLVKLKYLNIGDEIICNGIEPKYENRKWLKKRYIVDGLNQIQIAKLCDVGEWVIANRIKVFNLKKNRSEWMKNHYVSDSTKFKLKKAHAEKRKKLKRSDIISEGQARYRVQNWYGIYDYCRICKLKKNLLIHHIDSDIINNSKDNLMTVCKSCHEQIHSPSSLLPLYEKIVSIEYDGYEETYDLEIDHPDHVFVANGMVVHNSEYSILDGMSRIERGVLSLDMDTLGEDQMTLVRMAKQNNQPGVGLTDHGTLGGFFRFHTEAVANEINPIIGIEWYLIKDLKYVRESRHYNHITMFAKNYDGLKDMFKANEIAWSDGFYYRPRIDYNLLEGLKNNTIILSGCGGDSPFLEILKNEKLTIKEKSKQLHKLTEWFLERWREDFYFEIMPHDYEWQKILNKVVSELASRHGVKLVATNDIHYLQKIDEKTHEIFLCIQTKGKMSDPNHFRFEVSGLYMKTRKEMFKSLMKHHKYLGKTKIFESLDTTLEIQKKVHIDIPRRTKENVLPVPIIPKKYDSKKEYINKLIKRGWKKRDIKAQARKTAKRRNMSYEESMKIYKERLKYELDMINKLGFIDYFLIVHELINWSRRHGIIVGPGRGSSAASLFCYLLGITSIDPILYDLMFERFISEYKVTYPDIDMDFDWHRRGEIFDWMKRRFGKDNFAHIGTYGVMKGKQVIRDVSRVFDVPYHVVNDVTKYIIQRTGGDERKSMTIQDSFETFDVMKEFDKQYPKVKKHAMRLEGIQRNCIVGNTNIRTNRTTQLSEGSYWRTIEHLYNNYIVYKQLPKVKIYNGKIFVYKKVNDIWYTGLKKVYRVISGRHYIDCTKNEKFLTKNGYKELSELKVGDIIARNGIKYIMKPKWVKIHAIRYIGKRKTYDMSIDTDSNDEQNYIANGFIVHNSSIHPCGIIVSDQVLTDIVPIEARSKTRTASITGKECEKLGLLKIDILGLKTLSVIYKAVSLINKKIDLEKIDLENKDILNEFTNTNFTGVFQYDSLSMRNSVGGFKFLSFDDITIWNASNRPGVQRSGIALQFRLRREGTRKIPKIHPIYDRITKSTAGCVIYQEQISKLFSEMAGYTLADSDQIRVAIAKSHGKDVLNQYRIGFIKGCIKRGMEKKKAKKLFDQIVYFGSYCFNNAHAAAYSVISFWCMWLKYYHSLEFMTALLSEENDKTKIHGYIRECKRLGIKVIHPDINKSKGNFAICDKKTVISGFTDIKGIGEKASEAIIIMQPFDDFYDFINKINRRIVNKRVIKALVLSGAMDCWCYNKKKFIENLDHMLEAKTVDKRKFYLSELKKWNRMEDWKDSEKAKIVKEVFSLPSDKHPIEYYKKFIKEQFPHIKLTPAKTASYDEVNLLMWVAGEIIDTKLNQIGDYDKGKATPEEIEKRRLKLEPHGARYANFDIEDSSGFKKFTVRPIIYQKVKEIIDKGNGTIVLAKCRVQAKSSYIIYVDDMIDLDVLKEMGEIKMPMQKLMSPKHHPCRKGRLIKSIKSESKVDVVFRDLKFFNTKHGIMAFALLEDGDVNVIEVASFNNVIKGRMKQMVKYYKERKPFVALIKKEKGIKNDRCRYLMTKMSIPKG